LYGARTRIRLTIYKKPKAGSILGENRRLWVPLFN
jgi:hypothetical protein